MTGNSSEGLPRREGHRPAPERNEAVTYNTFHRLLGQQRSDLHTVIGAYQRGESIDGFSLKERMGALEGMVFDTVWQTHLLPHFEDPSQFGVHGLLDVHGLENVEELTSDTALDERVADPSTVFAFALSEQEWAEAVEFYQQYADGIQRRALLQLISGRQADTMLFEMYRWENERMHSLSRGESSPVNDLYAEFVKTVALYKPKISPAGIDYPVYRKVMRGLLFGTPFQWRVIRRFPEFAARMNMDWDDQTFDALMRGLEMLANKLARIHSTILVGQAEYLGQEGRDLSDAILCRKCGDDVQLFVDPVLMQELKGLFSLPWVPEAHAQADSGPATSCTALYSEMFTGTIRWNHRIAKELMVPRENNEQ